ncbi:MAG TPA: DUF4244 domain-containing protein [Mycobacteriales bacterium]|nr:DUF4244 domain-containing protein [Mycobacteriales bacterium]
MLNRLSHATDRVAARVQSMKAQDREAGMVASEYALATAMGAGCVGIVWKIVQSEQFLEIVKKFVLRAFHL